MELKEKLRLKKFIRPLQHIRGRHTELVSVYVPVGYDLVKIIQHLEQEAGTATNIKDARTRNNVVDSLGKVINHLRLFKKTPPNGLAVFAGDVSDRENKINIQVFSIEPPVPINQRIYRCDQTFKTDILEQMLEEKEFYALIVMDRKEATVGLMRGSYIQVLHTMTSGVPGKFKSGGQCIDPRTLVNAPNLIEIKNVKEGDQLQSFNRKTGKVEYSPCLDTWKVTKDEVIEVGYLDSKIISSKEHTFFVYEERAIKERTAEELRESDLLIDHRLNKIKIQSIKRTKGNFELIDIATRNQNFFANGILVHNSSQRFERLIEGMALEFYRRVAEFCDKTFLPMTKDLKGVLVGGPGHTKNTFIDQLNNELKRRVKGIFDLTYTDEQGLHDLIDASRDVISEEGIIEEKKAVEKFLMTLAKERNKAAYGKEEVHDALKMGAVDLLLLSEDLDEFVLEGLTDEAEEYGTKVQIISTQTREGQQLRDMGGVAAILRYPLS